MTETLRLLAVHAHPDDEVISTGGTLAHYARAGVRVGLACATRGEVGEIVDPSIDQAEAMPRLGEIREAELRAACAMLGVNDLFFLDYRDSGMAGTPDNEHSEAFRRADFQTATGRLVWIIRTLRPHVLVTYNEFGNYGHPDHIMAHRITAAAFDAAADPDSYPEPGLPPWQAQKLYYTAMPRSWVERIREELRKAGVPSPFDREDLRPERISTPDERITARIDVRDQVDRKTAALKCHRTQIAADSFFFKMGEGMALEGLGYEHFVRARSLVAAPEREDDLFAGIG